ncbi:MAG: protein kinase [Elusimicrobiota bacterium]
MLKAQTPPSLKLTPKTIALLVLAGIILGVATGLCMKLLKKGRPAAGRMGADERVIWRDIDSRHMRWRKLDARKLIVNNVGLKPLNPNYTKNATLGYLPLNPSLRGATVGRLAATEIPDMGRERANAEKERKKRSDRRRPSPSHQLTPKPPKTDAATNFIPQTQAFTLPDPAADLVSQAANSLRLGDIDDALAAADRAIAANPASAAAFTVRADALIARERYLDAAKSAWKATRLDPKEANAYRVLGLAQMHLEKRKSALANLNYSVKLNPYDARIFAARATLHQLLGDTAAMTADLERAEEIKKALTAEEPSPEPPLSAGILAALALGAALLLVGGVFFLLRSRPAPRKISLEAIAPAKPAVTPLPAADGAPLPGKYQRVRALGGGPGGPLWLVRHPSSPQQLVAKPLRPGAALSEAERHAARTRLQAIGGLGDPRIVRVLDLLEDAAPPLLVQEYVLDSTLRQVLESGGALGIAPARAILLPVCEALTNCHGNGILHLNLKPANIFVGQDGGARIADFRLLAAAGEHLAPELAKGLASPRSDIYSLGVCLREAVGEGPGRTPEAEALIAKATNAEPLLRHATVLEFQTDLHAL